MSSPPVHPVPAATGARPDATASRGGVLRTLRMVLVGSGAPGPEGAWVGRAARALAGRGHEADLLLLAGEASEDRPDIPGLAVGRLPAARRLDPRQAIALARVLRARRPHALLAGDTAALRSISGARLLVRLPPLYAARIGDVRVPLEAESALGAVFLDPGGSRGAGIPIATGTPVSAGELPPDRTLVRRELRLPRRSQLLLQVGRFTRGGGHETMLRALARLRELRGDASSRLSLVLVGTGPEETRLRELSHELGLQEHVLWIGHRHDPEPYVRAADLLIFPAPGAVPGFELRAALAAGTPVVAGRGPGVPADPLLEESVVLVPEGDPEELARALRALLHDPDRAAALALAGRKRVAATDSPEVLGLELECLTLAGSLRTKIHTGRGPAAPKPAVFLDRDGTLVRNVPYNADPAAVELEPGAAWALRCFEAAGLARVVVSNQSAVARGLCTEAEVLAVNERLRELLRAAGGDLEAILFCPHHPDHGLACECRKPEPGLLLRAARDLGLDLARSVTIGDEPRDLEAGRRAGTAAARYTGDWLQTCNAALTAVLDSSHRV